MQTENNLLGIVKKLATPEQVPGYMADEDGNLIRVDKIKDPKKQCDVLVRNLAIHASQVSEELTQLKDRLNSLIAHHVKSMYSLYDLKLGGKKGNVTLYSFDKRLKIERTKQERETTNEHILAAVELVKQCVISWQKGANRNLQAVVGRYIKTNSQGQYSVALLKQLRTLDLPNPDPNWDKAMQALDDAIEYDYTATYFRVYYRDDNGVYHPIHLDITKIQGPTHEN